MRAATSRDLITWGLMALLGVAGTSAWAAAEPSTDTPTLAVSATDDEDEPGTPDKPEKPDYTGPGRRGRGRLFSGDSRYSGLFAFGATRNVGGDTTAFTMVIDNGKLLTRNLVLEFHFFSTQKDRLAQYAAGPQALLRLPLHKDVVLLGGGGASLYVHSEQRVLDSVLFARAGLHATARLVVKIAVAGIQYQVVPSYRGETLKQWTFFVGLGVSGRGGK